MEKKFYVIQIIPGTEHLVKSEILKKIIEFEKEDQFGDILVPESKVLSSFSDEKEKMEQLLPGYVIVSLIPSLENFRLILTTNRVFKFLGGDAPSPLSKEEVDNILERISGKVLTKAAEVSLGVGSRVNIKFGPFTGFSGTIGSVDEIKQKFVVMVSIFGRLTPVEISFDQVEV